MYCDCGEKISSSHFKCICDWTGWNACHDWPKEKPEWVPIIKHPPKDGIYLVRKQSTCGDRYEDEESFSVNPIRYENGGYLQSFEYPVHWEKESWDDDSIYAWKEIEGKS